SGRVLSSQSAAGRSALPPSESRAFPQRFAGHDAYRILWGWAAYRENISLTSYAVAGTSKTKAPEQTFEEVRYLRNLSENRIPVRARLTDNSEVEGIIEFYDVDFIRLTRDGKPNLFLYKHDIKYL